MKRIIGILLVCLLMITFVACEDIQLDKELLDNVLNHNESADGPEDTADDDYVTDEEDHTHSFTDATCLDPARCEECGEISEEALGHDWALATCTAPSECTVCGEISGEALGHDWALATCTALSECTVCGEKSGEALGHDWISATCTSAKRCKRCEEIQGEPMAHNFENGACVNCNAADPNYVEYTVFYNANGGWGETKSSTHYGNEKRALTKNAYKRAGYTFQGWSTDPNAVIPQYTDAQNVKNLTKINGDAIILYAVWKEATSSGFDECKPTNNSVGNVEYHATATDNLGNIHSDVAIFANRDTQNGYKRYDERYTQGIFTRIQGTIYLSDAYKIDKYTSIRLVIKADGVIVYKSEFLKQYSGSQTFDVDITGVSIVEIYVEDPESTYISYWNRGGDILVQNLCVVR